MRAVRTLALALALGAPVAALGVDVPHTSGTACSNCHVGHNSGNSALTKDVNYTLCSVCHASQAGFEFGSWSPADQSVPGTSGRSHHWSNPSDGHGATPPDKDSADATEKAMGLRLGENPSGAGLLNCSVCHDQHQADTVAVGGRGTQHLAAPVKKVNNGGSGIVTAKSAPAGMAPKTYWVKIVGAGNVGAATFQYSMDEKISWAPTPTPATTTASDYALSDGVVITFGGSDFKANEEYWFYVSYPFLRADNTDARMCVTCHKDRNMTWENVEGTGNLPALSGGGAVVPGTTVFSHPVNQALSKSYDRTVGSNGAILDADGSAQAPNNAEGNWTNDLTLSATGKVTCLSCHHPHLADSNSLTIDKR